MSNVVFSASSDFAKMSFSWYPSDTVPNDFRGKVTRFYYQGSEQVDKNQKTEVVIDVVRSDGRLVEVEFTDADFAFGATLHSMVGKNVWLLIVDNNDALHSGGYVMQLGLLNDDNHWYQSTSNNSNQK